MKAARISLKCYIKQPASLELPALIPVFHRWIQQQAVPGMLIDVADYKHVHEGPGIVLIGHECDYRLDLGEGRPGLCYVRKRETGDLGEAIGRSLPPLLAGCAKLEEEESLGGIRFETGEVLLIVQDRLSAPNTPETFEAIRRDVQASFEPLRSKGGLEIERVEGDARRCAAVRVRLRDAPALPELLARLRG